MVVYGYTHDWVASMKGCGTHLREGAAVWPWRGGCLG